jgi:hypothetical protein
MGCLVMPNQSAVIHGRAIHARKSSSVLLKVDITKAFNTVGWALLIEILRHMGFSQRWTNWISILLSTASTRILLIGNPGHRIAHSRGLRQGDPLSPLLFVLVMEPLRVPSPTHRLSLYAGDLVIFVKPLKKDLRPVQAIVIAFAGASGLHTNTGKCLFTPIHCSEMQLSLVQQIFSMSTCSFPLHLPWHTFVHPCPSESRPPTPG